MALIPIMREDLAGLEWEGGRERARAWCSQLEAGDVLYFPETPVQLAEDDLAFLRGQQQTDSGLHKNIAYKPNIDCITGYDAEAANSEALGRLQHIMRQYSLRVVEFLSSFLAPYERRWRLDYASFRPQEEEGRDLPLRRRNDLLHTDAFPTRPTHGARILRFFNNIHPTRTRDWVVSEPFAVVAPRYAPREIALPAPAGALGQAWKTLARTAGLGRALPSVKRSPYDDFMMRFHNFLKENASYQEECAKCELKFPPGSSWMVYTDTVPHAVLAGQYALEQTLLVDHKAMVVPAASPLAVLEKMTRRPLV